MPNIEKKTTGSSSDGYLSGCLILLLIFGGCSVFVTVYSQRAAAERAKRAAEEAAKRAKKAAKEAEIERIQTMPISEITLEEIYKIYSYESKYTALQKDEIWKNYQGKKVKWTGIVSSVSESSGRLYMWV